MEGKIIKIINNSFTVLADKEYICNARGKFKNNEISPVAGDIVEIEPIREDPKWVIVKIDERKNYLKRPKMANLSQIVLVISMKLPKPDLELLDKQLVYAEYLGIKSIICLNKIDLVKQEDIEKIQKIYTEIGYTVILTNAKTGEGVEDLKEKLEDRMILYKDI